jgi:hypothetical protein
MNYKRQFTNLIFFLQEANHNIFFKLVFAPRCFYIYSLADRLYMQ